MDCVSMPPRSLVSARMMRLGTANDLFIAVAPQLKVLPATFSGPTSAWKLRAAGASLLSRLEGIGANFTFKQTDAAKIRKPAGSSQLSANGASYRLPLLPQSTRS
ncbi:hypothetical protein AAL_08243 [Moelleriella libera RCEF 2490]|uniref:Uncharacterized protein n=1 Tax=Moelleriella libera RCEF 2490 TaxID=1081109 RepID=A0A162IEG7_9HYPO|nr:hypothetical protein AAL_08243 [Moelleriella libera RCEF 2490]